MKSNLTAEQVSQRVSEAVYDALAFVETEYEAHGEIIGNGHHMRTEVARYAAQYVSGRLRVHKPVNPK